jgi:hypothetical protein
MKNEEITYEIDRIIKDVWMKNIKDDYFNDCMINEDCLKICMYYHLRRRLSGILRKNNLRIFTEYNINDLKYRADMVIAEVDPDFQENTLSDSVKPMNLLALIELKFTGGSDMATEQWIRHDLKKLKDYRQYGMEQCLFYFAVVYESPCSSLNWLDKRSTNNWAKGCVTELNAGLINDKMVFKVNSYNGLNH